MQKIGIRGICYDARSSYLRGPAAAPALIREVLSGDMMNLYSESLEDLRPWKSWDLGDFEIGSYFEIEGLSRGHLGQCRKLFTLGGDHSIAYPILKAYAEKYPKLDILQIDDAVKVLWKKDIYAETGMGCTGPVVLVPAAKAEKAKELLVEAGYVS